MQIELGNAQPLLPDGETTDHPHVTYWAVAHGPENFPDGHHGYVQDQSSTLQGQDLRDHFSDAVLFGDPRVSHLPGHEPVIAIISPVGVWKSHAQPGTKPTWVWSDDPETERLISEYYDCPRGRPDGVEDTHHTNAGPPGVVPGAILDLQANITQDGRDMQARMFGGAGKFDSGVSTTAPTATTYTLDGKSAPGSTTSYTGQRIIAGSSAVGCVWGNVISNTNAAPPVLTVDRWYNSATPGGAAATTPVAGPWITLDGVAPAWFMGLSASTTALATPSTNTSLPGEITTAGGGLIRQQYTFAHTAGTATTTLTSVATANGSDSLPVTIGSEGTFNSMVVGDTTKTMFFNILVSPTATLSASGDQLTTTKTITET